MSLDSRWPDQFGRPSCAPCRGYTDYCAPLGCYGAVLDELLWELFGWIWLLGGRTELETWTPGGTMFAGCDDDWRCESCGRWFPPDHGCADEQADLCDDCWAEVDDG